LKTTPETDARDLARGAGVNYVGYVARLGGRVPFMFLAGLLYGEASFGVYTFAISVIETAASLATFGLKRSLYKFLSDEKSRTGGVYRSISAGLTLTLTAALIVSLLVAAVAHPLADLFNLEAAGGFLLILCAAIPLIVTTDILLVTIRFTRQMRFDLYARSLVEPITLTVAIVVAYLAGARESGLAIGYVVSMAAAALVSLFFFLRIYSIRNCLAARPHWSELRRIIVFSAPTAGYELLLFIAERVDVFLVSYFMPASAIGVYGMARQFSTATKKIRMGFDRILQPVLSDSLAAGFRERAGHQLGLVARWILVVQAPVVMFFAFWGGDLLGLMGGGFAGGATVLVFLAIADMINGTLGVSEIPFVYLRPVVNTVLGIGMLIVAIGLGVWLIGVFGLEGAAFAMIITVCVVNLARILLNYRLFDLVTVTPKLWKPLAAAIPSIAAVVALQQLFALAFPLDMIVTVPVLASAYLGTLYLLGLEAEDRAQLQHVRDAFHRRRAGRSV
jgi:O-antigen/teichoic acid export membrane protein